MNEAIRAALADQPRPEVTREAVARVIMAHIRQNDLNTMLGIDRAADAVLALLAASTGGGTEGWRPIESAPRNVTVLGFIPNAEHYGHGVYRMMLVDMGTGPHWSVNSLHMGRDADDQLPTHWMPLPAAPTPAEPETRG